MSAVYYTRKCLRGFLLFFLLPIYSALCAGDDLPCKYFVGISPVILAEHLATTPFQTLYHSVLAAHEKNINETIHSLAKLDDELKNPPWDPTTEEGSQIFEEKIKRHEILQNRIYIFLPSGSLKETPVSESKYPNSLIDSVYTVLNSTPDVYYVIHETLKYYSKDWQILDLWGDILQEIYLYQKSEVEGLLKPHYENTSFLTTYRREDDNKAYFIPVEFQLKRLRHHLQSNYDCKENFCSELNLRLDRLYNETFQSDSLLLEFQAELLKNMDLVKPELKQKNALYVKILEKIYHRHEQTGSLQDFVKPELEKMTYFWLTLEEILEDIKRFQTEVMKEVRRSVP